MRIGVAKEIKTDEYRVALTPAGALELVQHGHEVLVETTAGDGSAFPDADYERVGARIVSLDDVWAQSELLLKVKEPIAAEYGRLREGLVLFTYLHIAADEPLTRALVASGIAGVAYETVETEDRRLPLLAPMSEVAGRLAAQAGAYFLEKPLGGRGLLLGGVPGVAPGRVAVLGGGIVGYNAAIIALGLGAQVTILERSIDRMRYLDEILSGRVSLVMSSSLQVEESVAEADVVIGAVLIPGALAPKLVTRAMLANMKKGSVVVDVAIDQGGCFETSQADDAHQPGLRRGRRDALLRRQHARRRSDHVHARADERDPSVRGGDRRARAGPGGRARPGARPGRQRRSTARSRTKRSPRRTASTTRRWATLLRWRLGLRGGGFLLRREAHDDPGHARRVRDHGDDEDDEGEQAEGVSSPPRIAACPEPA